MNSCCLPLALAFIFSGVASAQSITLISQERQVKAESTVYTTSQTIEDFDQRDAPGYGLFDASANSDLSIGGAIARAYSDQTSDVVPERIYARGFCNTQAGDFGFNSGKAVGRTTVVVDFQVNQAVSYRACGTLFGSDDGYGDSSLEMGSTLIFVETAGVGSSPQHIDIDQSGILTPGTYKFRAAAYGTVINGFGDGEFDLLLSFEPLQVNYCLSSANSVGSGAVMGWSGSSSVEANQFDLTVTGAVPGTVGLFYYGTSQVQLPFGDGVRCVGRSIKRFAPRITDGAGQSTESLQLGSLGDFGAGVQCYFQYWYQDSAGGGAGYNLSDGLQVVFCP